MAIQIVFNGQTRVFNDLEEGATIAGLITALEVQPDRVAIELNGSISSRKTWAETIISPGDRVEMVHFVGGGSEAEQHSVEIGNASF